MNSSLDSYLTFKIKYRFSNNSNKQFLLLTVNLSLYTISIQYMLYIESLEIDDNILEKIENKHHVTYEEAEDICNTETHHVRKSKSGLYKVFGKTRSGRYLLVVLVYKGESDWKIVTARDMTAKETQLYRKATR
jgi:uncharacterized DUF497 family protein